MLTSTNKQEITWVYNLLEEIYGEPMDERYMKDPPSDLPEAVDKILDTILPREKEAILLRFRDGKTYTAIGEELNICRNRAREITMKALRKLRHPSHFKSFLYGFEEREWRELRAVGENALLDIEIMMKKAEKYDHRDPFKLMEIFLAKFLEEVEYEITPWAKRKLSIHSLLVLHKHGIFTVGDFTNLTKSEINRYSREGDFSLREFYDCLVSQRMSYLFEQKKKMTPKTIEGLSEYFNWYYGRFKND